MTYEAGFKFLQQELQQVYAKNEGAIIADWAMEHFTHKNKSSRALLKQQTIAEETWSALMAALKELLQHRPVQYVLGETQFAGLRLLVNEAVLIPRPETEELVVDALEYLDQSGKANPDKPVKILDIGTGSGCIPIALKKAIPHARVTAIDLMENALETARKNGALNKTTIDWLLLNFLDENSWAVLETFDLIVTNPPYIPVSEKQQLDENVVAWEPSTALFVPDNDPLIFYRKIALFAQNHLQANGRLFLECHQNYAAAAMTLFREMGYKVLLKKDLFGNNRFLQIKKGLNREA